MRKSNILFIPDLLRWKISKKWSTVVILLLVVLCMAAHTVENLSSFLFAATAVSAPPAVTSILWSVLPPCLLNWLTSHTDTVFSQLMKIYVIFFFRTELCFIVFFILLPAFFPVCSLKWINPEISLPAISWFFILLAGISNGILTFTVWFPKVATAMTESGSISPILIILSSETLFVLRYLTKWKACLVPLSKRSKPYVIPNTNKVSMFMPNRINVIQKT